MSYGMAQTTLQLLSPGYPPPKPFSRTAAAGYLLGFQRIAFSGLYLGLSVVWLLFIAIRQFHTGWMFSDQVALRSQNDR